MAYAEKQLIAMYGDQADNSFTLVGTGVKARWSPATQGCTIRRFAVVVEVAATTTACVMTLKKRPTPGSASGEVILQTLTLSATEAAGTVVYGNDLQAQILPGEQVVVDVTTAGVAANRNYAFLEIDPDWETSGNFKATMINRTT